MLRSAHAPGVRLPTALRTGLLVALLVVATGCTDDGGDAGAQPDGAQLISRAAEATRQVDTVQFSLRVDGKIDGISISQADGSLTSDGKVKGTAVLTSGGQPVETEFVVVGDVLYLKGPTGGYQQLPASVAATIYDPTKILDDNLGLAALVGGASQPVVHGTEEIDGVDSYRVTVVFARNNLGVLLPGAGATEDLAGELWLTVAEPNRPVRARVEVPAAGGNPGGTVTISLSEFNSPVDITPPG